MGTPEELLAIHCKGASILLPGNAKGRLKGISCRWFQVETGSRYDGLAEPCIHALVEQGVDLSGMSVRHRTSRPVPETHRFAASQLRRTVQGKRIWILFVARNKEFYATARPWDGNLLFPFLIIIGYSFLFGGNSQALYKVGVVGESDDVTGSPPAQFVEFKKTRHVEFVEFPSVDRGLEKLRHPPDRSPGTTLLKRYWIEFDLAEVLRERAASRLGDRGSARRFVRAAERGGTGGFPTSNGSSPASSE